MFRPPKSVLSFAAGALVVGVLILAVPRAAHAIAATLVEVTNTAANPATTQNTNAQAAQILNLNTLVKKGQTPLLDSLFPDGFISHGYTVPPSQFLVITTADLTSTACNAATQVFLNELKGPVKWWTVSGLNTLHFDYPQGIVLASDTEPYVYIESSEPNCSVQLQLHGYLTSN